MCSVSSMEAWTSNDTSAEFASRRGRSMAARPVACAPSVLGYGWDPTGSRRREPAGLGFTRSGSLVAYRAAATGSFRPIRSLLVGGEGEVSDDGLAF